MRYLYVANVSIGVFPKENKMKKGACPDCDGKGTTDKNEKCSECGGTGWIEIYPESVGGK